MNYNYEALNGIPDSMEAWGMYLQFPFPSRFGEYVFPGGGPDIGLTPRVNHWINGPSVLKGNAQKTNFAGYAQHTFKAGGEDIWVWDVDKEGVLRLSSAIVKGCNWVGPPVGQFLHTGVKLRFQRRQVGIVPRKQQLEDLETRVAALEKMLGMGE